MRSGEPSRSTAERLAPLIDIRRTARCRDVQIAQHDAKLGVFGATGLEVLQPILDDEDKGTVGRGVRITFAVTIALFDNRKIGAHGRH